MKKSNILKVFGGIRKQILSGVLGLVAIFNVSGQELPETVVDVIVGSEVHQTLAAAVGAAGLVETLQGEGPFTVFAPTDAAFDALGEETIAALLAMPEGDLTEILLYHVLSGKVLSTDLEDGIMPATINGQPITINIDGSVTITTTTGNVATVILADLEAENGVVHVIDAVLLPEILPATVVDVILGSEIHQTLAAAVGAAGLVETLEGEGPFTVFAPTDAAFDALGEETIAALLAEPEGDLTEILLYHVLSGKVLSTDLEDGIMPATINGQPITINIDGSVTITTTTGNVATVILADLEAKNGVVHVIDAVLLPEILPATVVDVILGSEIHQTLAAAVGAAGLVETLQGEGPFTVFAPTDAAFDALGEETIAALLAMPEGDLTEILLYHVLSGKVLSTDLEDGIMPATINGQPITIDIDGSVTITTTTGNVATVILADLEAKNGVVHVIDAVLIPEILPATVVDVILGSEIHQTLAAAVGAAGLVETLQGEGPFTVFAPTDAAFAALGQETIDALLAEPEGDLTDILLYHVVSGKVMSSDLTDGQVVTTLSNGATVTVAVNEAGIFINGIEVTVANLEAENGVVHVIETVLIPETEEPLPATVVDVILGSEDHTTLAAAVGAAGLIETLQGAGPFTVFAPNNAAFDALGEETIAALLADPAGDLTSILLYHVLPGKVLSTDLVDGMMPETVNGQSITINIDGTVTITTTSGNTAIVGVTDLEAENGVVHVIDAVLVPTGVLSVENAQNAVNLMDVYPNPTSGLLMFDTNKSIQSVRVFNSQGNLVRTQSASGNSVNLEGVNTGVYMLLIDTNEGVFNTQVVVE